MPTRWGAGSLPGLVLHDEIVDSDSPQESVACRGRRPAGAMRARPRAAPFGEEAPGTTFVFHEHGRLSASADPLGAGRPMRLQLVGDPVPELMHPRRIRPVGAVCLRSIK